MGRMTDKGRATLHATNAGQRRFVCMLLPQLSHWLTISGACSKDAVANEMAVSDAYELQVNVYTPFKAKAGAVEDVSPPKEKTLAQDPVSKVL